MAEQSPYEKEITLPSQGLLYRGALPEGPAGDATDGDSETPATVLRAGSAGLAASVACCRSG